MIKIEYYYKQPKQEYFDEVKSACIKAWGLFDDQFGYATEKINQIKDLENNYLNYMMMIKMFHVLNWEILAELLSLEVRHDISIRLNAGVEHCETDFFNIFGSNEAKDKYGQLEEYDQL
jgi:hypothetical protein